MEDGRMAVEYAGFVFLAVDIENFLFFCDGGERLIDDLQRFQSIGGGVQLTDPAIDQDQAGEWLLLFQDAAIPASNSFFHAGEIVVLRPRNGRVTADRTVAGEFA